MLKFLVPRVGQLGLLDLAHCDRLTDTGCAAVVARCAELTDLNLTSCAKYCSASPNATVDRFTWYRRRRRRRLRACHH